MKRVLCSLALLFCAFQISASQDSPAWHEFEQEFNQYIDKLNNLTHHPRRRWYHVLQEKPSLIAQGVVIGAVTYCVTSIVLDALFQRGAA